MFSYYRNIFTFPSLTEGFIISKCVPGLCGIGGVCLTIPIGFFCICPEGLSGDRCQLGMSEIHNVSSMRQNDYKNYFFRFIHSI